MSLTVVILDTVIVQFSEWKIDAYLTPTFSALFAALNKSCYSKERGDGHLLNTRLISEYLRNLLSRS